MVKAGMKELDIDTMSASLEQTLHSASDMIGLGFIYYVPYNIIHIANDIGVPSIQKYNSKP